MSDESRLIERAKRGDPAAVAEIYRRHQPAIYRYVYYRVGDVSTAEDLTSEVFVRLVERIDRFTYRGRPLLAWLYTIARNLIADHYRRAGKMPQVPLDEQLMASTVDPRDRIGHALTQQWLAGALSRLTEEQSEVILLRFVEGLDHETVGRLLDKSLSAVKSLQYRGLIALRQILERNGS